MEYTHAGIKIKFDERTAKFSAVIEGKTQTSTALQALKNRIDNAAKNAFQPFQAIYAEDKDGKRWRDDGPMVLVVKTAKVVGIEKAKGRYHSPKWIVMQGERRSEQPSVAKDTPENRAALEALTAHKNESYRIRFEREKQEEALEGAVQYDSVPRP